MSVPSIWRSVYRPDPLHPHSLVNDDGRHLFLLNKTAWVYFGCRQPEAWLRRAQQQGVNVIRVALEGRPYWEELGIELWPFGGTREAPDFSSFNEPYWDEVDQRIELAGRHGMGIDLVLNYSLHPEDPAPMRPCWERAIARLDRHANLFCWEIQNEWLHNSAYQDAAGAFFRANDPQKRPVITSDHTFDDSAWPEKPWVSLAVTHSCTGSGNGPYTLADWYLPVARNTRSHGKPGWCNESGREKRHKNDDGAHRRKQGWLWCAAGCYWSWHAWDGCEGMDDPDYRAPGEEFVRPMVDFCSALPFWRMNPNWTAVTPAAGGGLVHATLAGDDRGIVLTYLCTEQTGAQVKDLETQLRLPPGRYRIRWFRPADGASLAEREHIPRHIKERAQLPLPTFTDDLAMLIERLEAHERTMIPGTE